MFRNYLVAALMIAVSVSSTVFAQVRVNLQEASGDPIPLAVPDFFGATPGDLALGSDLAQVIRDNFSHSALFSVVDQNAYLQSADALISSGPIWKDWQMINSQVLLAGTVEPIIRAGEQKLKVTFRVYDVVMQKQLVGLAYNVKPDEWRYAAHRISDDIYEAITGEKGYFYTRIVHIGEQPGPDGQMMKKLCVMDQDGANYLCLTDGRHLVLTPRYDRGLQKVIYMSYAKGVPRLYYLDLPTGRQEIIGDFEGLNSSPRFGPDGDTVAMTLTQGHEGNAEIYTMRLSDRKLRRLTNHRAIDTSPDFSPDASQIVFNSDRAGKPALYIMNADGTNTRRLTYGVGRYYAPVWSPRGDLIAFVKELNGVFHIGVIDTNGQEERLLTDSFLDESPTWSPNGRVLSFARQDRKTGKTQIYTIDLTGYNLRQINTPTQASDPAWSPLMGN